MIVTGNTLFRIMLALLAAAIFTDRHIIHGRVRRTRIGKGLQGLESLVTVSACLWTLSLLLYIGGLDASAAVIKLPQPIRWIGVALMVVSGVLSHWAHLSLGKQLSRTTELAKNHELVQAGPYRFVRHPIYAILFLCAIGTCLISSSATVAGTSAVVVLVFIARIRKEEAALVRTYGEEYLRYRQTTGALFPKIATILG